MIRSKWSKIAPTYQVPCEHCGHVDERTEWQTLNTFHCYECSKDSKGKPELAEARLEPV